MMNDFFKVFFANSSKMKKIKAVIDEIAETDMTVLVKGESGTGKGVVAQAIHQSSARRGKPFITVNCAAIPNTLLESELFGFEKGAFTGAYIKKPGKFELASGGTILLNEIEEIDISLQAKLLQVLQDGGFARLGGEADILVNARVIATTRENLEESMLAGRFREDLFFRINVMNITLPPLRERKEQVVHFCQYFFDHYRTKYARSLPSPFPRINRALEAYHWPGNIRELENIIKRIILFGEEEVLNEIQNSREGYPANLAGEDNSKEVEIPDLRQIAREAAEVAEKEVIQKMLQETLWNRKETAKLLGISYKALLYKIQRYRLDGTKSLRAN